MATVPLLCPHPLPTKGTDRTGESLAQGHVVSRLDGPDPLRPACDGNRNAIYACNVATGSANGEVTARLAADRNLRPSFCSHQYHERTVFDVFVMVYAGMRSPCTQFFPFLMDGRLCFPNILCLRFINYDT